MFCREVNTTGVWYTVDMSKSGAAGAAFREAYASLNAAQKKAVDTIEGPVMVIAGPGTGKTQILTLRIAKILKETDMQPENILALTFTNSGVRAMRERLREYIGDEAYRVTIHTFHSFAEHILTHFSSYFPEREFSKVIEELERVKMVEAIISEGNYKDIVSTYDPFSSLKQVVKAIDEIKQEGIDPEGFLKLIPKWEQQLMEDESMLYKRATGKYKAGDVKPTELLKVKKKIAKAKEVADVFSKYQERLHSTNRYDFSDMILSVLHELIRNENLKLDLQEMYQYILVDEHQDTNDGQNSLIEHLTDAEHLGGRPNLFTVGDEKQSIYRFQGASAESFSHFQKHYTDVTLIELEQNYRSKEAVLNASHELIERSVPTAKRLKSNHADDTPVSVLEFSDYKFELLYVTKEIEKKLEAGVSPDEIAVIYRSNKHLAEIKLLFQQFGVPYQVLSRDTLLDDPAIMMFIDLLKVVHDPYDDHSLGQLLFADFLKLDPLLVTSTLRAYQTARRAGQSSGLVEFLAGQDAYAGFLEMLQHLTTFSHNRHFTEVFKEALQVSGFLNQLLKSDDSQMALRKVDTLFNEVKRQADQMINYSINDFVSFIEATKKYDLNVEVTAARAGKGVACLTAHGSKGLEFAHVYLINTARSNWEKNRGFPGIALPLSRYKGELDDERRLFYVAMTRAKEHLTISSSKQDWYSRSLEPSQFISELDRSACELMDTGSIEASLEGELQSFLSRSQPDRSVFDPDYLKELFLEQNLSVTGLNNYLDCPMKFLFRNLIQLPDVYSAPLRYGDAIHKALERFFKDSAVAGEILPKETLVEAYTTAMNSSGFFDKEYDQFLKKGIESLSAYYDTYHNVWSVQVELELYVRRSLAVGEHELTLSGILDKVEFQNHVGEGAVRIVDYKTGKPFSEKGTKEQKDALIRQIQFYHLLLKDYKEGAYRITEAVLDFVEPGKSGEFEQKTVAVSGDDVIALERTIQEMTTAIVDGSFLKSPCKKKDCEACELWFSLHQQKMDT